MRLFTCLVIVLTLTLTSSYSLRPFYTYKLAWSPFYDLYQHQHPFSNFEVENYQIKPVKTAEKSEETPKNSQHSKLVTEINKILDRKTKEAFNRTEILKNKTQNQLGKLQRNGYNKYDLSIRIT